MEQSDFDRLIAALKMSAMSTTYNNSEVTQKTVTLTGNSDIITYATTQRSRIILVNPSTANPVTVRFDGEPATLNDGLVLSQVPGTNYWDSGPDGVPIGMITAIGTAGQKLHVISFVKATLL